MGAFLINDYDCIFIHIPKTAGTSIRKGVFQGKVSGPFFNELDEQIGQKFGFAFVRNPYDRLVSAWKMFAEGMRDTEWSFNGKHPLSGIVFTDFLRIAIDENIDHDKRDTIQSVLRHHTLPQVSDYHCFQYADFIGKFENLTEDFKYVAKRIGLNEYSFAHLNSTKRTSYKEYYDEESFEIVTKYYAEDINRFGYKF